MLPFLGPPVQPLVLLSCGFGCLPAFPCSGGDSEQVRGARGCVEATSLQPRTHSHLCLETLFLFLALLCRPGLLCVPLAQIQSCLRRSLS